MRSGRPRPSTVGRWGRAEWTVEMTVEQGRSDQAGEPSAARIATLLGDAQRALAEAEQLLAEVQQARTPVSGRDLAARQAAIVDAAHEEAAAILAKAHADAARVLEHAVGGQLIGAPDTTAVVEGAGAVVDLRGDDSPPTPDDVAPVTGPVTGPGTGPGTDPSASGPSSAGASATGPVVPDQVDSVDADVRASIAAAADMVRRVSGRIERLSHDLHQAPAS